jgi:phage-related protein
MRQVKPCYFVGPSKRDISAMPDDVKSAFGAAFFVAQTGGEVESAKALKGFGGRGATPKHEIELVKAQLKDAEAWHHQLIKGDI